MVGEDKRARHADLCRELQAKMRTSRARSATPRRPPCAWHSAARRRPPCGGKKRRSPRTERSRTPDESTAIAKVDPNFSSSSQRDAAVRKRLLNVSPRRSAPRCRRRRRRAAPPSPKTASPRSPTSYGTARVQHQATRSTAAPHADLQHQIHRDLKRWRDTPISEAAMRRAIDDPAFTLTVAVHDGRVHVVRKSGDPKQRARRSSATTHTSSANSTSTCASCSSSRRRAQYHYISAPSSSSR